MADLKLGRPTKEGLQGPASDLPETDFDKLYPYVVPIEQRERGVRSRTPFGTCSTLLQEHAHEALSFEEQCRPCSMHSICSTVASVQSSHQWQLAIYLATAVFS